VGKPDAPQRVDVGNDLFQQIRTDLHFADPSLRLRIGDTEVRAACSVQA
jgi:hypothetical protein